MCCTDHIKIIRVVIADDSCVIRCRLAKTISRLRGIIVARESDDVETTLEAIRTVRPNVVVLDIQMPGGSGIDVLEQIKKEQCDCVVIMLTNFALPPLKKKCLELGADYFFDKTTEFEKVSEVLKQLSASLV
jgi:DNA-binding NarL/FixJ family response regulator